MSLPADLLTRPAEEAARLVAEQYVDRAEAAAKTLARGEGEEDLHDYRVAVRRLRATLRGWKAELRGTIRKKHRSALRALLSETGGGRDFEVAAQWIHATLSEAAPEERAGKAWLATYFEARHGEAMTKVHAFGLKRFQRLARKLRKRLRRPRPLRAPERTFAAALVGALRIHMDDVILRLAKVQSVNDLAEAHAARIRVKRLRYLVEPLEDVLPDAIGFTATCKRLQEVLGELNDTRVLQAEMVDRTPPEGQTASLSRGFAGVRRDTHDRQQRLFAELQGDWLTGSAAPLREQVNHMILACATAGPAPLEIERKFLLRALPAELPAADQTEIRQGWLPGAQPRERLRARSDADGRTRWTRTLKSGPGLERVEVELDLSEQLFDILWPLTIGSRVHKRRHAVPVEDHVWELDEFLDRDGLFFAEVELRARDDEVGVPSWLRPVLVREVTGEPGFTNQELAQ